MKNKSISHPHAFCFSLNMILGVQQFHFHAFYHTTHSVQPFSYGRPSTKFCPFKLFIFFVKCSGIWSSFILIFMYCLVQFSLAAGVKILSHLHVGSFIFLVPKFQELVGKEVWFIPYDFSVALRRDLQYSSPQLLFFFFFFFFFLSTYVFLPSPAALTDLIHSSFYNWFSIPPLFSY